MILFEYFNFVCVYFDRVDFTMIKEITAVLDTRNLFLHTILGFVFFCFVGFLNELFLLNKIFLCVTWAH